MKLLKDDISTSIWKDKYRYAKPDGSSDELTIIDTHRRVVNGVYAKDPQRAAEAKRQQREAAEERQNADRITQCALRSGCVAVQ